MLTDPRDKLVPGDLQNLFVEKLRKAGGEVEQFFIEGHDEWHHGATSYAVLTMRDCIRGASHDEIAADLAPLVAKARAANVLEGLNTVLRTQDAPPPRVGALLKGTRYWGDNYANFWIGSDGIATSGTDRSKFAVGSQEPQVCQKACRSDAKCVAWTYVEPGVQGNQARCWLMGRMPPTQSPNAPCCTSGVERVEPKGDKVARPAQRQWYLYEGRLEPR